MKKTLARSAAPRPARAPFTLHVRLVGALSLLGLVAGMGLFAARPAHTAGGPIAVNVANTPLLTSPTDEAAPAQPFGQRFSVLFANEYINQQIIVPAHKRLFLTYVSGTCYLPTGSNALLGVAATVNGHEVEARLPLTPQGPSDGQDSFATSDQVTICADANSTVTVFATDNSSAAGAGLDVSLYGYYVNAP